MCWEDIKIARATHSTQTQVSVGQTMVELVAPNQWRYAIAISAPLTNNLSISTNLTQSSSGMVKGATDEPLLLDLQHHGDIVRQGFYGLMDSTTQTITVWEAFLHLEDSPS